MTGAALASLIAILLYNLVKFGFIKYKFGFNPYNIQFIIVLALSAIIYFIILALPDMNNFIVEILIDSILASILFYFAIRLLPIAKEANLFINQLSKKAIRIIRSKIK